ncbi:MAG: hypothetical protein ACR2QK_05130 [Acidimicrobiales bacterium]
MPPAVPLAVGAVLLLAGCGGETTPSLGNDTLPTTVVQTTTSTMPPTTTTTINFDRPPDQEKTPLPEEATVTEMAEVIDDMRGPTRDMSEQMMRLATFIKLSSPIGSQIMDFTTSVKPAEDEGSMISTQARLRTPFTLEQLVDYYDSELKARGWNKAGQSDETTDGMPASSLVFRIPGTAGDEAELTIDLTGGPVSFVDLDYRFLTAEDDESFARLEAWQSAVRTPNSAIPLEARAFTANDLGTVAVSYSLLAETATEAREAVVGLVRSSEFTIEESGGSGENTPPVLLIDESGQRFLLEFSVTRDPEVVEMVVSASFDLEPVDPGP